MSIIEETRIALLELFPELAAADVEASAQAEAEAQAKAEAEAEATMSEPDAATAEQEAQEPIPDDATKEQEAETTSAPEGAAPKTEAGAKDDEQEPEEEEPRQNGVLVSDYVKQGVHLDVLCDPDQVVDAAQILDQAEFFIEAITGVDWIKEDQLEVIYDYNRNDDQLCRVVVRTRIPRSEPVIPTISSIFPGADWHERETYDFFGIRFQGHSNLIRILLPEDADFYPLLKDFTP